MTQISRFTTCPSCLYKGLELRMDKKGRPFFRCCNCGCMLFARLGTMGVANVVAAMGVFDNKELWALARKGGMQAVETLSNGGLNAVLAQPYTAPYMDAADVVDVPSQPLQKVG